MFLVGDSCAVVDFSTGGLLLDLRDGSYYRLNASALHALRERSGAVEALLSGADRGTRPASVEDPFSLDRSATGYLMSWRGRAIASLSGDGRSMAGVASPKDTDLPPELWVLFAAPHLLQLQGFSVLHAAAVLARGGGALVFAGQSGAGKTTLARAFADAGATLLSEDFVVANASAGGWEIAPEGERAVRAWARAKGERLARDAATVDLSDLPAAIPRNRVAVTELWLLDGKRRTQDGTLRVVPVAPDEALGFLLAAGFGAVESREIWLGVLASYERLVASTKTCAARVPSGMENLAAAVRRYSSNATA